MGAAVGQVQGVDATPAPDDSLPHNQVGLVVDDLQSVVARLTARRVSFEEYPPRPGATMANGTMDCGRVKAAWLKDTAGNLISLNEFPQGSPLRSR